MVIDIGWWWSRWEGKYYKTNIALRYNITHWLKEVDNTLDCYANIDT